MKKQSPWKANNAIEADLLKEVLTDQEIPFRFVRFGSSVFGEVLNEESGYGVFEIPEEYHEQMSQVWADFQKKEWVDE